MKKKLIAKSAAALERFETSGEDLSTFEVLVPNCRTYLSCEESQANLRALSMEINSADSLSIFEAASRDTKELITTECRRNGLCLPDIFRYSYWDLLVELHALDYLFSKWRSAPSENQISYISSADGIPKNAIDFINPSTLLQFVLEQQEDFVAQQVDLSCRSDQLQGDKPTQKQRTNSLSNPKEARTIAWGSSYDALIVLPDALRLSGQTKLPVLLVAREIDSDTKRTGLTYQEEYRDIEHFNIATFLSEQDVGELQSEEESFIEQSFEELLSRLDRLEIGRKFSLREYFGNHRGDFLRAFQTAKKLERFLEAKSRSHIVLTHFNGEEERVLEQLAPQFQIALHGRLHGWIAYPEAYDFRAERFYTPGKWQSEFFASFFPENGEVERVSDPNIARESDSWHSITEEKRRAYSAEKRSALGIDADHVVAFLSTASVNRIMSSFDSELLNEVWEGVFTYLQRNPNIFAVVKSHPKFNYTDWLLKKADELNLTNVLITDESLEETLKYVDLTINVSNPSTSILAALHFQVPLLLFSGGERYFRHFNKLVLERSGSCLVENLEELYSQLDTLQAEGESYLSSLLESNKTLSDGLI